MRCVRAEAFKSLSTRVGAPNAKRPVLGMISDKKYDFVHGVTKNAPDERSSVRLPWKVPWRWRRASAGAQSLNRVSAACIAILAMLAVDDAWSAASATQRTPTQH